MESSRESAPTEHQPNEWEDLRGHARHQTVEVLRLVLILVQDAVILVLGFVAEFIYEHWLHSSHPLFQLAVNLSSAFFILLYVVTVTVHVVHYVRGTLGASRATLLGRYLPWVFAAGGMIAAAVAVSVPDFHREGTVVAPPRPVGRLVVALPPNVTLDAQRAISGASVLAISRDGRRLVYLGGSGVGFQLFVRSIDSLEATPLADTFGGRDPFFSPDGEWIGYNTGDTLKKISVSGGPPVTLCTVADVWGGTWAEDGKILFGTAAAGLMQVSASGGQPQPFTTLQVGETAHRFPQFLNDGKTVLFNIIMNSASSAGTQIGLQYTGSKEHKILIRGGEYAHYAPSGHLIYYRAGTLMAVPFDPVALEVKGTPAPVVEGIMGANYGNAQYGVSDSGSLIYITGTTQSANSNLVWVNRQGVSQPLPAPPRPYRAPRLSPDGTQVVVGIENDVWLYNISRETLTRFTFESNSAGTAAMFTPDSKRVVFPSNQAGPTNLFWKAADGSGEEERLTTSPNLQRNGSFSPDGRIMFFSEVNPKTGSDLWWMPMDGDRKPHIFLQTPYLEGSALFSPDGHWVAYGSDESGRIEIYVRPFSGPGGKWQISTDGATEAAWSPKGHELFFRTGKQKEKMMVVDYQTEPTFSAGKPRLLFEGNYSPGAQTGAFYSVSPDGQRFLMMKPAEQQQTSLTQINVVLNWFEELKQKVPVK